MSFLPDNARLPTLETPRLRLRWLDERDLPALNTIHSDPLSMVYWNSAAWTEPRRAAALLAGIRDSFARRELFRWGIADGASDRVIGMCSLHRLDAVQARGELSYILESAAWGQGYAREALRRLIDFAFDELGLTRLAADADPLNAASCRLLLHLGFTDDGVLRENWPDGSPRDSALFSLLADDWRCGLRP